MSARPDERPPLSLTVDRTDAVEASADREPGRDPVLALARALLDNGAATCITDRRGELLYANAAYRRIADAVAEAGLAPIGRPIGAPARSSVAAAGALAAVADMNPLTERKHAIQMDGGTEHYGLRHERWV